MAVGDVSLTFGVCVAAIRAVGRVLIGRAARYCGKELIATGGLRLEGAVETDCSCGATVHLVAGAMWKGRCRAKALIVEQGATIAPSYFEIGSG